ncbi:hypothetical protein D9M71_248710 [compost metagenome]
MLVALAVIDLGWNGLAVTVEIGRIERGGGRDHRLVFVRRVEVDRLGDFRGRARRQRRRIDLQIGQYAGHDLAIGIDAIALQAIAIVVDDVVVFVSLEGTGTGIVQRAVVAEYEEALALDTHVEHVASVVDVALAKLLGHGGQAHAIADALATGAQVGGGIHIGELGTGRFETCGRNVGDVVAGHVQLFIGCIETAKADIE